MAFTPCVFSRAYLLGPPAEKTVSGVVSYSYSEQRAIDCIATLGMPAWMASAIHLICIEQTNPSGFYSIG